jgi:hypothetical protein
MKALKILFLLPLSMLSFKMTAQVDDLLKNKDITWIAETYNDFLINESLAGKSDGNKSRSMPLKLVNKKEETLDNSTAIMQWLATAIESEKILIYRDSNCTERLNAHNFWSADSISQINPYTHEIEIKVTPNHVNPERISSFRARQIVYYNAKKAQFGMRTIAIAPIYAMPYRRPIYFPIFWFKPQDLNKMQRLSKKNITWASRMSFVNGLSIHSDSVKILKKVAEEMPLAHLFSSVKTNRRLPFYQNGTGIKPRKKISFEERKDMFSHTDTLRVLDPLTYKESYKTITEETKPSDCESLQLIQNWYWNDRKKRLEIYLVATAPLKDSYFGGYKMPLFYCRTDD